MLGGKHDGKAVRLADGSGGFSFWSDEMTRDDLARIALRYDTAMARAMLRALGVPVPHRARVGTVQRVDRYDGLLDCFAQRTGVRP